MPGGVGDDQSARQSARSIATKRSSDEAFVPNFDRLAQRTVLRRLRVASVRGSRACAPARESTSICRVSRGSARRKASSARHRNLKFGGNCQRKRAQLLAQVEDARGEEVGERATSAFFSRSMCVMKAGPLHRETKPAAWPRATQRKNSGRCK
jgi:hypothetical protein